MRWLRYSGRLSRVLTLDEINAAKTIPGAVKVSPLEIVSTHDAGPEIAAFLDSIGVVANWTRIGDPPDVMPPFETLPLSDEARECMTDYQRRHLATHVAIRGGLVEWPCGTGKTFFGCAFVATRPQDRILVITKGSTTWQWLSQFRKWTTIPLENIHVLEGRTGYAVERAPVGRPIRVGQWLAPKREVFNRQDTPEDLPDVLAEIPKGTFVWSDVSTETRNGKTVRWLLKNELLRVLDWTPEPRAGWRVRRNDDTRVDNWRREIGYFDRRSTEDLLRVYPNTRIPWTEAMHSPDVAPYEALQGRVLYHASMGATEADLRQIVMDAPRSVWDPADTGILPEDYLDNVIGKWAADQFARREEGVLPSDVGSANIIITSWSVIAERRLALQGWGAQTIVVDEAHLGKDHRVYRSVASPDGHGKIEILLDTQAAAVAVLTDGASVRRVLAMTATPLQDRPRDMYAILRMLDPRGVGRYSPWSVYFCAAFRDVFAWNDKGASHEAELAARIACYRSVVTKAEAFAQLPRMKVEVVNIPATKLAPPRADAAREDRKAQKMGAMAYMHWKLARAAEIKTPYIVERAREFVAEGGKVVILTALVEHAQALHAAIQPLVACPVYVGTGNDSGVDDRRAMVAEFTRGIETDDNPAVLIGTLAAWCEGIDGLQGVHHVLVAMTPWNLLLIQMLGRYERLGAVRGTRVEIIVASGTVDEQIISRVLPKYRAAVAILNNDDAGRVHNELLGHIEAQDDDVLGSMADDLLAMGAISTPDEDD